jgi:hypothetical protein
MSEISDSSGELGRPAGPGPDPRNVRLLKGAVYIMAILLVAGTVLLFGAIVWKASRLPATTARGFEALDVAIPAGAAVKSVEIAGDRMAVTVEAGGRTEIIIVDLKRGELAGRVRLAPGEPVAAGE